MFFRVSHFSSLFLIFLIGCAPSRNGFVEPRPLGRQFQTPFAPAESRRPDVDGFEPGITSAVSLRTALAMAMLHNPRLQSAGYEVRLQEARALQAGTLPNPELSGTMEDAFGTGIYRGQSASQWTLEVSQLIQLSGQRNAKKNAGLAFRDAAGLDYEVTRLEVLTETARRFYDMLYAQEKSALTEQLFSQAQRAITTVTEKVRAGRSAAVELLRAEAGASLIEAQAAQSRNSITAAKQRLAEMWGQSSVKFDSAIGSFPQPISEPPPLAELSKKISANPEMGRWAALITARELELRAEKAGRFPDIRVSGGYRKHNLTDDHAFVASVSIPLPVFDRNQGAVRESEAQVLLSNAERKAAEARINQSLAESYVQLASAFSELRGLNEQVLPKAEQVWLATEEGYRAGKFGFLELLDAQRLYTEAQLRRLATYRDYYQGIVGVERLLGIPLESISEKVPNDR